MFSSANLAIDRLCHENIYESTILEEIDDFRGIADLYERDVKDISSGQDSNYKYSYKCAQVAFAY